MLSSEEIERLVEIDWRGGERLIHVFVDYDHFEPDEARALAALLIRKADELERERATAQRGE